MKILIIFFFFLFLGCGEKNEISLETIPEPPLGAIQVDYDEVKRVSNYNHIGILDVRTEEEYRIGHIEGAILIPLDELNNRIDELLIYDEIIIYCRTNNRATTAFNILKPHFENIYVFYEGYEKCCN